MLWISPATIFALSELAAIPPDDESEDLIFRLSGRHISRRIGQACEAAGLGKGYSGHSLRVGAAQTLAAANISLVAIMENGPLAVVTQGRRSTLGTQRPLNRRWLGSTNRRIEHAMALTNCWECGESVSEHAETCPHCGIKSPGKKPPAQAPPFTLAPDQAPDPPPVPPKKKSGCGKFLLYSILIIIVLVVLGIIIGGMQEAGIRPTSTATPTPGPTPTWDEWKKSAEEIPYEELFRYAEDHEGKRVYYRGKVVQVLESRGDFQLRVNVTSGEYGLWDDTVFVRYDDPPVRILEEDIIEFVGRMNGTVTYESVLGGEITIPDITVLSLKIETE